MGAGGEQGDGRPEPQLGLVGGPAQPQQAPQLVQRGAVVLDVQTDALLGPWSVGSFAADDHEGGRLLSAGVPAGGLGDWVATAPTPGSSHGTSETTEKACDCTATPSSPVEGSRATIEKVTCSR